MFYAVQQIERDHNEKANIADEWRPPFNLNPACEDVMKEEGQNALPQIN
ncbi:MAG: hypothetical protein WCF60_16990 [Anaerobacillus sp.]